jgi:Ulp1 family protease
MSSRTIKVFDSLLPVVTGRKQYLEHILKYLEDEQEFKRIQPTIPFTIDYSDYSIVPQQGKYSNDCGVFTCLFMDFLMLNLPLQGLTQENILNHGRNWLCSSILNKLISF